MERKKKIRIHSIIMKANLIEPIKNSTTFKPVGMRFSILRLRTPLIITLKKQEQQQCCALSSYYSTTGRREPTYSTKK